VGDGASTLFWKDPWLDGVSFDVRYARLYDVVVNKLSIDAEMIGNHMVRLGSSVRDCLLGRKGW
jgi:hypothetical protein